MKKDNAPCISVIIPVYNKADYLDRCMASILSQTYRELEIILIDDGSKDNSPQICDRYAEQDERVTVIHKANAGVAEARNDGIRAASGSYIGFIDPDDYISLDFYEKLFRIMKDTDSDAVLCSYCRFIGEKADFVKKNESNIKILTTEQAIDGFFGPDGEAYVVPWNKLLKRELLENIWFPKGKVSEDEFTLYKFLANAKRIAVTDDILYYYYHNNNSETTQKNYNANLDIYEAYDERTHYLRKIGFPQFEAKGEKQYLDRIIQRNRALFFAHEKEAKVLLDMYRRRFRRVRKIVPGIGYYIYYIFPRLYYLIVDWKKAGKQL